MRIILHKKVLKIFKIFSGKLCGHLLKLANLQDDLKNPNDDSNSGGGGGYMTTSGGSGSVAMRQFHPATPSNEDILSTQVHNLQVFVLLIFKKSQDRF